MSDGDKVGGAAGLLLRHALHPSGPLVGPDARRLIEAERTRIDGWFERGGRAYGFTTLYGHLDDPGGPGVASPDRTADEAALLRSHLIAGSQAVPLGPVTSRCVWGAKVLQLARGGSGISPETFDAFVARASGPDASRVPLAASYSCGDVVPGAWVLAQSVADLGDLRTGDVIAGISGSHVSTGIGTAAFALALDAVDAGIAWRMGAKPLATDTSRVQTPVSLRWGGSLERLLGTSIERCAQALDERLGRSGANPLFVPVGSGDVEVRSTSAYLGLELADALLSLRSSLLVLTHHLVVLHTEVERAQGSRTSLTLQFPKVLQALQSRLVQHHATPPPFLRPVEGASEGLEDVADHSLHLALEVAEVAAGVHSVLDVCGEHLAALGLSPAALEASDVVVAGGAARPGPEGAARLREEAAAWTSPALR